MAATIKVRDALWRIAELLNDSDPQFERWKEVEQVDALNDAQLAIAKFLPTSCSRVDSVRLVPGARQSIDAIPAAFIVPGDGIELTDPVQGTSLIGVTANMGANGSAPGDAVRIVDREILDAQVPGWRAITGTKVRQYTYDPLTPRIFHVSPAVPASPAVWVELAYNAQPRKVPAGGAVGTPRYHVTGNDATLLSLADEHIDDIVNYVVARMLMKHSATVPAGSAATFVALFTASLNAKVQVATGHNPNLKRLPLAPEPIGAAS